MQVNKLVLSSNYSQGFNTNLDIHKNKFKMLTECGERDTGGVARAERNKELTLPSVRSLINLLIVTAFLEPE